ncbi:unnamed protein product, partial [Rotaria sp. Silwood1]
SKHCLDYLKSKYGLQDGFIGYDNKILYSTWNSDINYYLQIIFQLKKQLPVNNKISNITNSKLSTQPINIFNNLSSPSNNSLSLINRCNRTPSSIDKKRLGLLILTDHSGSSEETGFETDTMDELSSPSAIDTRSISSESMNENFNQINIPNSNDNSNCCFLSTWQEESLTDEQKLENLRSRSSTISNDMEKTVKIEHINNSIETVDRIHIVQVDTHDNNNNNDDDDDDDDQAGSFQVLSRRTSYDRTTTVTSIPELNISDFHKSDHHELRVNWTNIADTNTEYEQDELVLYVQQNSRMIFAGVIQQSLLNDEYLKKLWNLMLSQMANMETEIQAISTPNEPIKLTTDVKFQFIENTHLAEFERISDGNRQYRKMPTEESTYMALFAQSEFKRNSECKILGLSRGNHLISVDRCLPDRMNYSCRRFQETY